MSTHIQTLGGKFDAFQHRVYEMLEKMQQKIVDEMRIQLGTLSTRVDKLEKRLDKQDIELDTLRSKYHADRNTVLGAAAVLSALVSYLLQRFLG